MNWHLTIAGASISIGTTTDMPGHYPATSTVAESIVVSEYDLSAGGWDHRVDPDAEAIRRAHQARLFGAVRVVP